MPDLDFSFRPVQTDDANGAKEMYTFSDTVYAFGLENCGEIPYQYSSYEIFQANNNSHEYKFINHINMTSRDVSVLYP